MKYFFIFLIFFCCVILPYWFYLRLRYNFYYEMVLKAFLKKKRIVGEEYFFSTDVLKNAVKSLLRKRQKKALIYLCFGRSGLAKIVLNKNLLKGLEAFDAQLVLCDEVVDKPNRYQRASKHFDIARITAAEGDMKTASECAALSCTPFNKEKAYVEEAKSYMLLGTIYQVSNMSDTAFFMFSESLKIFKRLDFANGIAEANISLGGLTFQDKRFEESLGYFEEALKYVKEKKLKALLVKKIKSCKAEASLKIS